MADELTTIADGDLSTDQRSAIEALINTRDEDTTLQWTTLELGIDNKGALIVLLISDECDYEHWQYMGGGEWSEYVMEN